jgi:uncharacterized membrane protein YfcA
VKGSIAFGFPTVATPLLALVVDVKTAIALTILPNIVMDGIQSLRRGGFVTTVRRLAVILVFGLVGMPVGTRLLLALRAETAEVILGAFLLAFVAWNVSGVTVTISRRWERGLAPVVGFVAGVVGGITNAPGTPLVVYFYALGMKKEEFVRSVAFSFLVYKVIQLGSLVGYGVLTWRLFGASVVLTLLGLGSFALGLRVQDRVAPRTFNRLVLGFVGVLGLVLLVRGLK